MSDITQKSNKAVEQSFDLHDTAGDLTIEPATNDATIVYTDEAIPKDNIAGETDVVNTQEEPEEDEGIAIIRKRFNTNGEASAKWNLNQFQENVAKHVRDV